MFPVLAILFILIQPIDTTNPYFNGTTESPKIKAALKYHGIRSADHYPNGDIVFYRNNKRCQLFTKSFEEYWRKKNG